MYFACALTVILEVISFIIAGYGKDRWFLVLVCAVNVATNLTVNMIVLHFFSYALVFVLEAVVILLEYAVYARYEGSSKWLFYATALANIFSFAIGCVMMLR